MNNYKILRKQEFVFENYRLLPLRYEDRYLIMKWRNEQLFHLRQQQPLSEKDQDLYFKNVVSKIFDNKSPREVLFSYLEEDICIGYGGLVHIDWGNKLAEISFIMNTELEENFFEFHWSVFLKMIEEVAFEQLTLHKIFTYAYDLRPWLYPALEGAGFAYEARLKDHCYYQKRYIDVIIHSKWNN